MKYLLLDGHGINMKIKNAKLHIKEGRCADDIEPKEYIFAPKRIPYSNIVIYGRSGEMSIEAIRWLIKHNVQVTILNWNGKLLTTMLPPESVQVKIKFAQYNSYRDEKLKLNIAKKIISAKISRSKTVLEYLKLRYPEIKYDFSSEEQRLKDVKKLSEVLMIEARIAGFYWKELIKNMPKKYEFITRQYINRPFGATDIINCMLNYGYALLEAECLRAIHSVGLDPHIGFLHKMKEGKYSLAYDLQEPFRFLIDLAVISAIEKGIMNKKDFIRTENYNLRLRPSGAKKLTLEVSKQLNKKVNYKDCLYTWSYVLFLQTRELAHYLLKKKSNIDFIKPIYEIQRHDTKEIRELILSIPYVKWENLGFSKGSLFHMKKNAKSEKPFTLRKHMQDRLQELSMTLKD